MSKHFPGAFEFVAPRGWWTVTPHRITERNIEGLQEVQGSHSINNGNYRHTDLALSYESDTDAVCVKSKFHAEQVGAYLSSLVLLSRKIAEPAHTICQESPWARGSFARQIMSGAQELHGIAGQIHRVVVLCQATKIAAHGTRR